MCAIVVLYSKLGLKIIKSHSYWHSLRFWEGIVTKVLCVATSPGKFFYVKTTYDCKSEF